MMYQKGLFTGEYSNSRVIKKDQSYKEWISSLRAEFKTKIDFHRDYPREEKREMVDQYITHAIRGILRKHVRSQESYPFHLRELKNTLMGCFHAVAQARRRTEEEIANILQQERCMEHIITHAHFYEAEGID